MDFNIILKKINNRLTPEEETVFNDWYNESEEHRAYFEIVVRNYDKEEVEEIEWEPAYEKLNKKLSRKRIYSPYWKVAAAAAVIAISFIIFYNKPGVEAPQSPEITDTAKIEIGSDKAILTLEDGSDINLGKGKSYRNKSLHSNGKSLIYNNTSDTGDKTRWNTLTIPRGGEFALTLADGTKIWLNSESQLKYPVAFSPDKPRMVELIYGEAYFEVSPSTKNSGTPFKVNTSGQEIEVLGTEFNIKAYKEEREIATTLVEGCIAIGIENIHKELSPGDQSVYSKENNTVEISPVNVSDEISWKKGLFSFKNKSLKEIMAVLSRWYNVDIKIENSKAESIEFNGVFSKKQDLEHILLIIENTNEAKFETIGKTIIMK